MCSIRTRTRTTTTTTTMREDEGTMTMTMGRDRRRRERERDRRAMTRCVERRPNAERRWTRSTRCSSKSFRDDGADARWERALSRISRAAARPSRRARPEIMNGTFMRRMREEREWRRSEREVGAEDTMMRQERAMRAREAERGTRGAGTGGRERNDYAIERRRRVRRCARNAWDQSRSYEEADLFDDPMGRDAVSAPCGQQRTDSRNIARRWRRRSSEFRKLVRKF